MSNTIKQGDRLSVSRDIMVDNQLAFEKGEPVIVEQIQKNVQRPEYQYVVFSQRLQKRFQLCNADVEIAAQPTVPMPSTTPAPSPQSPAPTQHQLSAKREKFQTVLIVVFIAAMVIGVIAFFVNSNKSEVKKQNETTVEDTEPATEKETAPSSSPSTAPSTPTPPPEPAPEPPPGPKPEDITLGEYNQIQHGMTYDQVVAIVGGSGMNTADVPGFAYEPPENGAAYIFFGTNPSNPDAAATVVFQNGVVIDMYQEGLI